MTHTATVEAIHDLTPRVKQFRLRVEGHEFDHEPGQHTTVQFDHEGEEVVRPYTPTSLPGTDAITLAIKVYDDGTASAYMHQRRVGDEVTIGSLEGNLTLRDPDADVAFVATGTGITPTFALLKQYLREGTGDVHFFFGEKDQESVIYRETLEQLEAEHENLTVVYSLSDSGYEWDGPTGHVQEHVEEYVDVEERDFYVCGVPQMVVDTRERLADLGAPDERVYTEGWEEGAVSDDEE
ncbi:ferredoxin--NADP reductase [Halomarina ordinaria]|uniref:Ferredoxin--NADP reductase n=1 Tax=Halomarina ordinaria TaxID=3033939 RepID=A0ABD5U8M6_9EURY|nr:FAD-dependent oxidoreductase [Halomarina sp. PSRA2]